MDAHPDHRIEYTARLDVARINSRPKLRLIRGYGMGSGVHRRRAIDRAKVGAVRYKVVVEVVGSRGSFVKSFMASAIGWSTPYGPTMLGPFRNCI